MSKLNLHELDFPTDIIEASILAYISAINKLQAATAKIKAN